MTDTLPLAQGFPAVTREQWRAMAARALARSRGDVDPADVERLLSTATEDGFAVMPLYTAADAPEADRAAAGSGTALRGSRSADGSGWSIRQRHWIGGVEDAADDIAGDLGNGTDSLWLTVLDADALPATLAKIDLDRVPVVVEAFAASADAAEQLLMALPAEGAPADTSLGLDPVGWAAASGSPVDVAATVELAGRAHDRGVLAFTIDSTVFHEAGASAGQELALTTASGVAVLWALTDAGMTIDEAAGLIGFRWVVTDEQFVSIAKLRAARVLWSRILQVAGAAETGQRQHAASSVAMLSARDPWVNLIRNCVAAFSGGVGGAAAVTVEPHTLAVGNVDEFAHRMARNTQHLLLSESHAGFVSDPAGGSYYVEELTRKLADAAWAVLQDLEADGGIAAALESGAVAAMVARTWDQRADRVARRSLPITGVSEFPETERLPQPPVPWTRPGGGLPQHRLAEAFEALRDRADAAGDPRVTLLALGPLARHGARQAFAANLFTAGGIGADAVGFAEGDPLEVAPVVCIVGADADYAQSAAAAAAAARAGGARRVWLAGRPGDRADSDAAAGIDDYLFAGCDAVAVLEQTLTDLGVGK